MWKTPVPWTHYKPCKWQSLSSYCNYFGSPTHALTWKDIFFEPLWKKLPHLWCHQYVAAYCMFVEADCAKGWAWWLLRYHWSNYNPVVRNDSNKAFLFKSLDFLWIYFLLHFLKNIHRCFAIRVLSNINKQLQIFPEQPFWSSPEWALKSSHQLHWSLCESRSNDIVISHDSLHLSFQRCL